MEKRQTQEYNQLAVACFKKWRHAGRKQDGESSSSNPTPTCSSPDYSSSTTGSEEKNVKKDTIKKEKIGVDKPSCMQTIYLVMFPQLKSRKKS